LSFHLIAIVGVTYAYIAVSLLMKGNMQLALVFTGFAISNIGLALAAR
jgi:hypothetical protein